MNTKKDIINKPVWVSDYQQPHLKIKYPSNKKPYVKTQSRYKQFNVPFIIWTKDNVRYC